MRIKGTLALLCSICILLSCFSVASLAEGESVSVIKNEESNLQRLPFYSEIFAQYSSKASGADELKLLYDNAICSSGAVPYDDNVKGESGKSICWREDTDSVTWSFSVASEGLYSIGVSYLNLSTSGNNSTRSLLVDGKAPFFEASSIVFRSKWVDNGEVMVNSLGDEVRPEVSFVEEWQKTYLTDSDGNLSLPFAFWFSAGEHTVTLEYVSNDMAIDAMFIEPYTEPADYKEVSAGYTFASKGDKVLTFQAEDSMLYRNDSTVGMTSGTDAEMVPVSNGYKVYNMIGNDTWAKGHQSVTFGISVPEDGLYKIGFRYRQKWNDGLPSFRKIAIDGEAPFSEMLSYKFKYSTKWETEILGGSEGEYLFELAKGDHTITLSVVQGEYGEIVHKLYDITTNLSNMMLDITMLTGNDPDPNYDYQFFKYIPTLKGDMMTLVDDVNGILKKIENITEKSTSISSSLKSTVSQFESMIEDPFTIAKRYSQISNAQTTLGSWYTSLQKLPLAIDDFSVAQVNGKIEVRQSNFFQNIISALKGFLVTFTRDYNGVGSILGGNVEIKETIEVWIGQGNEWAEILKEMTDRTFTTETGIQVDLSVVPSGQINTGKANVLLLSIISGSAPDAVFSVAASSPVEFAIRDATLDLSTFKDFSEVKEQFLGSAFVPLEYNGGTFAVPETMSFTALFYRTDIFEKYNMKVPNTWDELCNDTLQVLAQNGMQFYLPHTFDIFLFQNGGRFYTDNGLYSALDTPVAFSAYRKYVEMYTHFGCPVTASFFNRFRSGEMPIGVGGYDFYLQIQSAAPELAGKWEMTPMIGTVTESGDINRSTGGTVSSCCMILSKDSDAKYDECWEYLKWWIGAETQSEYARSVEALLGAESRWCSANLDAFLSLDWSISDRDVFNEQWKWVVETPVVLGSAYTARYLTNAYTNVVVSGTMTARDALETAVIEINRELKNKQEEYGVFADE